MTALAIAAELEARYQVWAARLNMPVYTTRTNFLYHCPITAAYVVGRSVDPVHWHRESR